MGLLFWKSNKEHDDFAKSLAEEFIANYPPPRERVSQDKKLELKFKKLTQRLYKQAQDYNIKVNLGVYGKARIGNKFMWELKDKGYEEVLIEEITTNLLRSLETKGIQKK